jgi:hypothetical protein
MADIAYLDEPATIGPKGGGGPAIASFFASASICPTPLPNGSSSEECPLIECRKRPAHDQSYANDPGRVKTQSVLWFPLLNRGGMMKGFVQEADRQQTTLLPECLDDWVEESNPVRAVDVFVDAL